MIKLVSCAALLFAGMAHAQYDNHASQRVYGHVVSVGPEIYQTVEYSNREPCYERRTEQPVMNGGTLLGAIVGGAVGSQVGKGSGRDVAMIAGSAVGASVGTDMANRRARDNLSRNCEPNYRRQVIGYHFEAEYNGLRIQGQMYRRPTIGMRVPMEISIRILEN